MSYDMFFEISLFGDSDSGKQELVKCFTNFFSVEDTKLSIGVDFCSKTTHYRRMKIKLSIWVMGEEERFKFLLSQYCTGKSGAIIIYDVANSKTLKNVPEWVQIFRNAVGNRPIMLVGNNLNLEAPRQVSREQANEMVKMYNLSMYLEISTSTGENVGTMFEKFTELVLKNLQDQ